MHPVVIEGILAVAIIWFAATQIILPALANAPLFPGLRFRRHLRRLDEARAEREARDLEREIHAIKEEASCDTTTGTDSE